MLISILRAIIFSVGYLYILTIVTKEFGYNPDSFITTLGSNTAHLIKSISFHSVPIPLVNNATILSEPIVLPELPPYIAPVIDEVIESIETRESVKSTVEWLYEFGACWNVGIWLVLIVTYVRPLVSASHSNQFSPLPTVPLTKSVIKPSSKLSKKRKSMQLNGPTLETAVKKAVVSVYSIIDDKTSESVKIPSRESIQEKLGSNAPSTSKENVPETCRNILVPVILFQPLTPLYAPIITTPLLETTITTPATVAAASPTKEGKKPMLRVDVNVANEVNPVAKATRSPNEIPTPVKYDMPIPIVIEHPPTPALEPTTAELNWNLPVQLLNPSNDAPAQTFAEARARTSSWVLLSKRRDYLSDSCSDASFENFPSIPPSPTASHLSLTSQDFTALKRSKMVRVRVKKSTSSSLIDPFNEMTDPTILRLGPRFPVPGCSSSNEYYSAECHTGSDHSSLNSTTTQLLRSIHHLIHPHQPFIEIPSTEEKELKYPLPAPPTDRRIISATEIEFNRFQLLLKHYERVEAWPFGLPFDVEYLSISNYLVKTD